jgi:hypothetical protein
MAEPKGTLPLCFKASHHTDKSNSELSSSLHKLSLNPQPSKSVSSFKKKQAIAESWEDEELELSGEETDRPLSPQQSADYPSAPPPTPISPSTSFARETFVNPYGYGTDGASDVRGSAGRSVRPDKTDAAAKRMIAGALGIKAPKKTEEQRAYDRALKEKEMKRRNQEKEAAAKAKEEAERAKAAVWDA